MPAPKDITDSKCSDRRSRLWWALKGMTAILAIFATVICLAFTTAKEASSKAGEAKAEAWKAERAAGKNKTEMQTSFSFVREGIQRIEKKLDKINERD